MFKCDPCKTLFHDEDLNEGKCPICGKAVVKLCERDPGSCKHPDEIFGIVEYCPVCGKPCCPLCKSHDVMVLSRITGYIQDVSGWNAGKAQELKDRTRYSV